MEDLRFINEYLNDNPRLTAKEVYKYWAFFRPGQIVKMALVGLYLLYIVYCCLAIGYIPTLVIWVMVAFLISYFPLNYFILINRFVKRHEELFHGRPYKMTISVSEDKIYPGKDEDYYINLSSVKNAYLTENYIIIVLKKTGMLLIVKKDSFTMGDTDSFVEFLATKGIKVKK